VKILNFALTLEFLEAAFYQEALENGKLDGITRTFAQVTGAHEQAHVEALQAALGSAATKAPTFDFKGTTNSEGTFLRTAQTLEDTGVSAYQGQAPEIKTSQVLASAGAILAVEARHAAWVRDIIGAGQSPTPAPAAFNKAMTMKEVLDASIMGMGSGSPSPAPQAFNPAKDMATVLAAVQGTGFITMGEAESGSAVQGQPQMTG